MNKIELIGLDKTVYKEKLDNGLSIYFVPYEEKNNYAIHYITKFGSRDTTFIPYGEDKMITVPSGIAHFLEHKMFESEDGVDPFDFASKTGTDCNAATSYNFTRYLFEGTQGFEENLDYLLTYVHTPYFTDENVEKEKGIIIEELLQYQDLVDYRLDSMTKNNLFQIDPMKEDIGGSIDSVNSITKEDLYKTYETFYQPSNMFLVITGKFDMEKAMEIIKNNKAINSAKTNFKVTKEEYQEPFEIQEKYQEIEFNSSSTKCAYSIKIPKNKENKLLDSMYYSMMLSMTFGVTSDFREKMKKDEMYTNFFYERSSTNNYYILSFFIETEKPKEIVEEIKRELKNIKPTYENLERTKKVWIASEVMMIDNINITLDNIVDDIIEYDDIIDNRVEIIRSLNLRDLKKLISNTDFSNSTTSIIYPKKSS